MVRINILVLLIISVVVILGVILIFFNKYLSTSLKEAKIKEEKTTKEEALKKVNNFEKVEFQTEDGVKIIGHFYQAKESKYAGILLHMMPAIKESYSELAKRLQDAGYSVLAIDFRGHGESINSVKGVLNYKNFTDKEHQEYIYDVKAASEYLKKRGFPIENQFLIGASIGANIALQFLSLNSEIKAVVLISPGLNYRGIKIEDFLKKEMDSKILVITGIKDLQSASSLDLFKNVTPSSTLITLDSDAHGTDLFEIFPDLVDKIIVFLREKLI